MTYSMINLLFSFEFLFHIFIVFIVRVLVSNEYEYSHGYAVPCARVGSIRFRTSFADLRNGISEKGDGKDVRPVSTKDALCHVRCCHRLHLCCVVLPPFLLLYAGNKLNFLAAPSRAFFGFCILDAGGCIGPSVAGS